MEKIIFQILDIMIIVLCLIGIAIVIIHGGAGPGSDKDCR